MPLFAEDTAYKSSYVTMAGCEGRLPGHWPKATELRGFSKKRGASKIDFQDTPRIDIRLEGEACRQLNLAL